MKVPLVDLKAQYSSIKRDIDAAIFRVINNSSFVLGEEVEEFEKEFAAYIGRRHCVGVNSGTTALYLALEAAGIGKGDEVIIPANTFIATAEAITLTGATPILVDVEPLAFNINPTLIEQNITSHTKAIIPVHLYGQCADMFPINELAKKYSLIVIEDACQAHGAEYRGQKAGRLGDMACFSFYPGKNLGCYGEGGAVVTDDGAYAEIIRKLRNHGGIEKYQHQMIGGNYRLESLQAAVLRVKLPHLDYWNKQRTRRAGWYEEMFLDQLEYPEVYSYGKPVWHLYVIRVKNRDKVLRRLNEKGIGAGIHYPQPIHKTQAYSHLNQIHPYSEKLSQHILSLPLYPELTPEQVEYVAKAVLEAICD